MEKGFKSWNSQQSVNSHSQTRKNVADTRDLGPEFHHVNRAYISPSARSQNDYFMTTSTAHAAKVMLWLEELLQTRWLDLKVHVTTVSEQWCGVSVAGPKSRECISKCVVNPEVMTNENLPFMGVIQTTLHSNITCRIARISFSGEMAFEIYVPSDYATTMMDMLWKEAKAVDGCLYGLEALGALRIEKGHVTGAELDGRMTIDDVGLGKMASTKKSYIGSSMRRR